MASALRWVVAALAGAACAAAAQPAYTARAANLRAGPAREFPVVAVLPAGLPVAVQGCLSTYTWCDVVAGLDRGWVWGGNVHYFWLNTFPPVLTWGPVIGVAIVDFDVDDYWGRHYRAQPWYSERHTRPPRYGPPAPRPGAWEPRPPRPARALRPGDARPAGVPAPAHPHPGAGPRPVRPPGVVPAPEPAPAPSGTRPEQPRGALPDRAGRQQRQYP